MRRLASAWQGLRASLWFVPALIVLASVVAAVVLIEADGWLGVDLAQRWPRLFGASADGSRAMLSAIATSMITVAGVIFSITIVALSLTSTQYSPRVLRNFMRDRPTQVVLGVFVGIFAYCLVVLRTIRGSDYGDFIPSLAVLAGMGYAFGGIGILIYFIHHVADSIQASSILSRIAEDTAAAIDHLFPDEIGAPSAGGAPPPGLPRVWTCVEARRTGYVTAVDGAAILEFAEEKGALVRVAAGVGDFVVKGSALLEVGGALRLNDDNSEKLRGFVSVDRQRTVQQDAAFGLQQLIDVAVKALSPGINDPTTACMCIDQLGGLLARLAARHMPEGNRMSGGKLRVVAPAPTFAGMLALCFDPLLHYCRGDLQVLGRMLKAISTVGAATADKERLRKLARVAREVIHELGRAESKTRSVLLRRQARLIERSLQRRSALVGPAQDGTRPAAVRNVDLA